MHGCVVVLSLQPRQWHVGHLVNIGYCSIKNLWLIFWVAYIWASGPELECYRLICSTM